VVDDFRALAPDLQVMAFVTLVVPQAFLDVPTLGTIQFHPSLLPRHRGRSSINWPIIKGETETGLSIFWPDDGLDTGDVLLQKTTPIGPDDTLGTVYFDRLFPMGVEAICEAVDLVKSGGAPRIPQDESRATYEGPCERVNARIDWGKPWRQIHDLVRGCDPAPGAWTTWQGKAVQVFGSQPLPARDLAGLGGRPGEVVEIAADPAGDLTVACADGRIRLARVRPEGGGKLAAGEWAAAAGLMPGDRLG
jgi:methionyl-tRNA formyltransferase